jgi:hypothetical protein
MSLDSTDQLKLEPVKKIGHRGPSIAARRVCSARLTRLRTTASEQRKAPGVEHGNQGCRERLSQQARRQLRARGPAPDKPEHQRAIAAVQRPERLPVTSTRPNQQLKVRAFVAEHPVLIDAQAPIL